jgi:hypothetical protein
MQHSTRRQHELYLATECPFIERKLAASVASRSISTFRHQNPDNCLVPTLRG